MHAGKVADAGAPQGQKLQLEGIVHLHGEGVRARGIVEQCNETLRIRIYAGRDQSGQFVPGAVVTVERAVVGGAVVGEATVINYKPETNHLQLSAPGDTLRLERREHRRVEARLNACVLSDRRVIPEQGWTVDVSAGGAALDIPDSPLEPGDDCEVWLRLPEGGAPLRVQCRVVTTEDWVRVEFGDMAEAQHERLLRFLLRAETEQRRQSR